MQIDQWNKSFTKFTFDTEIKDSLSLTNKYKTCNKKMNINSHFITPTLIQNISATQLYILKTCNRIFILLLLTILRIHTFWTQNFMYWNSSEFCQGTSLSIHFLATLSCNIRIFSDFDIFLKLWVLRWCFYSFNIFILGNQNCQLIWPSSPFSPYAENA